MENANLNRSLKRTFYRLSQRYGQRGLISKRTSTDLDLITGKTASTVENRNIRKLVRVAVSGDSREVTYTAAMMQTLRPFAWQGFGQNMKTSVFLIYANELRDFDVTPECWIRYASENYEVVQALKNEGGWIIEGKLAVGSESGIQLTVTDDAGLTDDGGGSVV